MSRLTYTMLHEVLLPGAPTSGVDGSNVLHLQKFVRYLPALNTEMAQQPMVVFDFETTGLDTLGDHIIEIGGLRIEGGTVVDTFSCLLKPPVPITESITRITGITAQMLQDKTSIEAELPKFLKFIQGSILVAHNADFDIGFLKQACLRQHIQLEWPTFCTLKMARHYLPELPSKNLDSLAEHFGLTFESRHRSIGDCKVTHDVLQAIISQNARELGQWQSYEAFRSS